MPEGYEPQLKIPSTAVITPLADKDLTKDRKKEEDEKENKDPLTNLPDKDASVLCELVYESGLFNHIINEPALKNLSLGQAIYEDESLKADMKAYLSKDDDGNLDIPLDDYASYYQPILAKYKLVAVSTANSANYFGIAVAHANDDSNSGIYVVNRGTTYSTWNAIWCDVFSSDFIDMGVLGKVMPVTIVSDHAKAGIEFANDLLKHKIISNIGFTGHSLGGSVAQNQAVYYAHLEARNILKLSPSKGFEPFGVKNEMDNLFSYTTGDKEEDKRLYYITLNPIKALNSWVCRAGIDWDCGSWQTTPDILVSNYAFHREYIKFKAFGRKGDAITNLAQSIGNTVHIDSAGSYKDTLKLHSMSNYRYQGYNDGGLITNQIETANADILKEKPNQEQIVKYRLCFNTPSFTNYEKI
jgi:hypothetical protein